MTDVYPEVHNQNFGEVGSSEVTTDDVPGESRVRRLTLSKHELTTQPLEGIETVPDVLDYAARTHQKKDAYGWRDIVAVHEEEKEVKKVVDGKEVTEKKKWKYFELSEYRYVNFLQVKDIATEVGGGFLELGIQREDIVNVYAATSPNWQYVSLGCSIIGTAIATAYETLGESGLQHSLNEPECAAIFTNADLLPVVANVSGNVPSLRVVVYDGDAKPDLVEKIEKSRDGIRVIRFDELRKIGKDASQDKISSRRPKSEDVACIMYTSGSTGPPKGVVITHSNLVGSLGGIRRLMGQMFKTDDRFIAYLPLAHILEYIVELFMLFAGLVNGYARVKTLTDASVRNCAGDIREFKPTIMIGVPAVWEMIKKGMVAQINKSGALKKSIFNGAYQVKKWGIPVLSHLADTLVFSQIRAATGGKLRYGLSGGAPISAETQEFISICLMPLLGGYGMTESCGMCAITPPGLFRCGIVGLPPPSVEWKLLDVPEIGYFSKGNPPQGEVAIRGPSVIKGYYKRDDLNKDETIFTKDGWLRTGDVGQLNPDGSMALIDRIKNLIKLQGGEYIALEKLESTYKSCSLVSNICVYASQDAKQPIAIIILHELNLRHALENNPSVGVDPKDHLATLCHDKRVAEYVLKECNAVGKKNGFKPLELLQAVILTDEEWTPENELLTAAQKLQRKKVAQHYEKEIKAAYKNQD